MLPIPPLVVKLLAVFAGVAIVAAGAYYEGHHHEALAFDAYKSRQAEQVQKQVTTNHDAVAAVSASEAEGLRKIAADAQESRNAIQKQNDALTAANGDLARKLRARLAGAGQQPAGVSQAAAGGPADHAAGDAALSDGLGQLVGFNGRQFYEADKLAVSLTEAQAVIVQDRQICNGALPGVSH